jgi:hypothetical protein
MLERFHMSLVPRSSEQGTVHPTTVDKGSKQIQMVFQGQSPANKKNYLCDGRIAGKIDLETGFIPMGAVEFPVSQRHAINVDPGWHVRNLTARAGVGAHIR